MTIFLRKMTTLRKDIAKNDNIAKNDKFCVPLLKNKKIEPLELIIKIKE